MVESATVLRVGAGALLPILGQPFLLVIVYYELSGGVPTNFWGNALEYFFGFWASVEIRERGGTLLQ